MLQVGLPCAKSLTLGERHRCRGGTSRKVDGLDVTEADDAILPRAGTREKHPRRIQTGADNRQCHAVSMQVTSVMLNDLEIGRFAEFPAIDTERSEATDRCYWPAAFTHECDARYSVLAPLLNAFTTIALTSILRLYSGKR